MENLTLDSCKSEEYDYFKGVSLINGINDKLVRDIAAQKDAILKRKLEELGVTEEDYKCRFPKISREIDHERIERWYYNDGSKDGKLFLTIHPPEIKQIEGENITFTAICKYE